MSVEDAMSMYENFILLWASSQVVSTCVDHILLVIQLILEGFESFSWGYCNSSILLTSFASQRFYMRCEVNARLMVSHQLSNIIVGNLNNSTIFTYRSGVSFQWNRHWRLIFCNLHKFTFNSTRMCFYHVLKYIFSSSYWLE